MDGFNKYQIKVCMKNWNESVTKPLINSDATNFKDLVIHSDIIVDKSLLVKSILEEKPLVSLTFPSKWGKTINLDMLKTFLDIEFNHKGDPVHIKNTWSYLYFSKGLVRNNDGKREKLISAPLIATHQDIIDKHLCKYPVVHLDFSTVRSVSNFSDYFVEFKKTVATVFRKYDFMIEAIRDKLDDLSAMSSTDKANKKNQLQKLKAFQRLEINDYEEMIKCIYFLSGLLREHFHQRVIVLIDNYDAPVQLAYFEPASRINTKEAQKFMNFVGDFVSATFSNNENVARGVFTGVFSLDVLTTPVLGLSQIVNYNAVSKNIHPFYGFTAIDVNQLLAHSFTPDAIKTILEKYDGYQSSNLPDITFYNPGGIANIMQKGKIDEHSFGTIGVTRPRILPQILRHQDVRRTFESLISRSADTEMKRRNFTLHRDDILLLNEIIKSEATELNRKDITLIIVFYFATGYLTLDQSSLSPNCHKRIHFRIPCLAIEREIINEMKIYYESLVGKETSANAESATNSLIHFIETDEVVSMRGTFLKFYQTLFDQQSFKTLKQNFLNVGNFLMLLYVRLNSNLEYNVGFNTTYYEHSERKLLPYITAYGKGYGLICGFNYTKVLEEDTSKGPVTKEWYRLKEYESFFNRKSVKIIRILALNYAYETKKLSIVRHGEEGAW